MAFESPEAEIAYWKKKAKGDYKTAKKKAKAEGGPKPKKSGCTLVKEFKYKDGTIGPMLWGWRISKRFGFQSFTAYLSQNGGEPKSDKGKGKGLVFVVNQKVEGLGLLKEQTGWWSLEYKKLTISDASLVANPYAEHGGYFGRGGERYRKQATA